MGMRIDIQPYAGAPPITFGMTREQVHRLLGPPRIDAFESRIVPATPMGGGFGDECLVGGEGDDYLWGEAGADYSGGTGDCWVSCDIFYQSAGDDRNANGFQNVEGTGGVVVAFRRRCREKYSRHPGGT